MKQSKRKQTPERVLELIDEQREEIDSLNQQLQEFKDQSEQDWKWARHRSVDKDESGLPVPRLEIRCEPVTPDWYMWRWEYALVYKHLLGNVVTVPLGETKCSGGTNQPPIRNGIIDTPIRDGVHIAHDAEQLNLPAFAICNGVINKIVIRNGKKVAIDEYVL